MTIACACGAIHQRNPDLSPGFVTVCGFCGRRHVAAPKPDPAA